ncbi:MAG: DNA gyrase inhibitor YacG [Hyphomicrobium sp.]|nr:DNA gyrase inhibitor YacG [Hyphomicrobium sp.]
MTNPVQPKPRRCPICSNLVGDDAYRPFCSRRCADVDLGRWLTGSYAIPGTEGDDEADAPAATVATDDDLLPH